MRLKMLATVEATNFKCFGEPGFKLDLAPLTFLVGPNGSGKSSVLDAISLLAQTKGLHGPRSGFAWQGPLTDLGDNGKFAPYKADERTTFSLGVGVTGGDSVSAWLEHRGITEELTTPHSVVAYNVAHSPHTNEWRHSLLLDGEVAVSYLYELEKRGIASMSHKSSLVYPPLRRFGVNELKAQGNAADVLSPNLFRGLQFQNVNEVVSSKVTDYQGEVRLYMNYIGDFLRERVFVVGAERSAKESELKLGSDPFRVGRGGEGTYSALSILFAKPEYSSKAEKIRRWATAFGLAKLSGGWTGEPSLSAGFVDAHCDVALPTRLAGFGSQQILPVIVQLFSAPPDSLVMIEEPEISLHPEAQVEVIRMLAAAIADRKQVIVTTHSQTLLLALSELGEGGNLQPKDVAVYHFLRSGEASSAKRLEVDDTWYIRGWVPSFSEVEGRLMKRWIRNVGGKIQNEA